MPLPVEDCALIGNTRGAALVGRVEKKKAA